MEMYRHNADRVPSIAGRIVPEPLFRPEEYRIEVLERMYLDIAPLDPEGILRDEWLNSRGVIPRFDRSAFEIRVLDVQECPAADIAIARATVGVLKALVEERWASGTAQRGRSTESLEEIFLATVRDGESARIRDIGYARDLGWADSEPPSAGQLWSRLVEECDRELADGPLGVVLRAGTLSTRILRAVGSDPTPDRIRTVYARLADCLAEGRMFRG